MPFASLAARCAAPSTHEAVPVEVDCPRFVKGVAPFMDPQMQPVLWNRPNQIAIPVRDMFGEVPRDLDDFIAASQLLQAEALKYFVELHRSRKFTRSDGLMWWNLRDGWPVLSDAVVDYYNRPKRAYRFLRNVQRDQLVMIADDGRLMAVNDALIAHKGTVRVREARGGRTVYDGTFEFPPNGSVVLTTLPCGGRDVFLIDYTVDDRPFGNHYLCGCPPFDLDEALELVPDYPF